MMLTLTITSDTSELLLIEMLGSFGLWFIKFYCFVITYRHWLKFA
jgi:hypothetical protein